MAIPKTNVRRLNREVNYQSSEELMVRKEGYPLGSGDDKETLVYFGEKICEHKKPLSVLLMNRPKYGMTECPSFVEFKLLVAEKTNRDGGKFLRTMMELESEILSGATYEGVSDGIDEVNPIKIKGNQILNGMLIKKTALRTTIEDAGKENGEALLSSASTEKLLEAKRVLEVEVVKETDSVKAEEA